MDGSGSTWTNLFLNGTSIPGGSLSLGGPPASLTIQNGGLVHNGNGTQLGSGSQLTITGAGSSLVNDTGGLSTQTGGNSVVVSNGGTIRCFGRLVGNGEWSGGTLSLNAGDTILVVGTNSSIVCSNSCDVSGTFTLLKGGSLTSGVRINVGWNNNSAPGVLCGNGVANGNLAVGGGTLAPSDGAGGIGTLTINGNLNWGIGNSLTANFALGTNSDQIAVTGNLDLNGSLNITTAPGVAAGTYTLFTYGGAFQMETVNTAGPKGFSYAINTNTLGQVNLTSNPPMFAAGQVNDTNLAFSGTSGFPNQTYYVIASTNLTSPRSQWLVVATNLFNCTGNFTFTNAVGPNTPENCYSIRM